MKSSFLLLLLSATLFGTIDGQCPLNQTIINCFLNNLTESDSFPEFEQVVLSTLTSVGSSYQDSVVEFVENYYGLLLGCGMPRGYLLTVACDLTSFAELSNVTCICLNNASSVPFGFTSPANPLCPNTLCNCPNGVNVTTGETLTNVTDCFIDDLLSFDLDEDDEEILEGPVFNFVRSAVLLLEDSVISGLYDVSNWLALFLASLAAGIGV